MFKKIVNFLFPTKDFNSNAVDRDGDGLVQEGTRFERAIIVTDKPVKKAVVKKKAAVKKAPAKKAAPVKKTAKKAPVKKAAKKK